MSLLLDSTVLIDFLRGRPVTDKVDRLAASGETLAVSPLNIEEVVRGLKPGESDNARRLFAGLVIIPLRKEEAWQAGLWRGHYAAKGVTLSQSDCLVGATAYLAGARLATGNPAHFPMPGLEVEHWPVGR